MMNDHPHGPVMSDDPDAGFWEPKPPEPVKCPYCGNYQYFAGYYFGNGHVQWYTNTSESPVPCKCSGMADHLNRQREEYARQREKERNEQLEKERLRRIEINRNNSGMPAKFKRRVFSAFKVDAGNNYAFRVCKSYSERFDELATREQNGLMLIGPIGTGKTHLAAAIANVLLDAGKKVICMTSVEMLAKIRSTYKDDRNDDDVIQEFRNADLLIIDDLGKEKPSEWSVQMIYSIVNSRYENEFPIIITTNYTPDELVNRLTPNGSPDTITARATVDRLNEMCISIHTAGASWRTK